VNLPLVLKCEPALEGDLAVGLDEEFLEIVALAVGRCVHRIGHDRPHAVTGPFPRYAVDDRHDVGHRFARPGAGV